MPTPGVTAAPPDRVGAGPLWLLGIDWCRGLSCSCCCRLCLGGYKANSSKAEHGSEATGEAALMTTLQTGSLALSTSQAHVAGMGHKLVTLRRAHHQACLRLQRWKRK